MSEPTVIDAEFVVTTEDVRPLPDPTWRVEVGDCCEVMAAMEPNSIDAVVCDPPYGLEFMGKEWDKLWHQSGSSLVPLETQGTAPFAKIPRFGADSKQMQAWHETWAREAFRVLKPGGFMLSMGGTRTYHRLVCAIEDAGFEIRDTICWHMGSGFPKSLRVQRGVHQLLPEGVVCRCGESTHGSGNTFPVQPIVARIRKADALVVAADGARSAPNATDRLLDSRDGCLDDSRSDGESLRPVQVDDLASLPQQECAQAHIRSAERVGDQDDESLRNPSLVQCNDRHASTDCSHLEPFGIASPEHPACGDEPFRERDSSTNVNTLADVASDQLATDDGKLAHHTPRTSCSVSDFPSAVLQYLQSSESDTIIPNLGVCRTCYGLIFNPGIGTALKPSTEFICLARKPLIGTVAQNVARYGTGGLNVDGTRVRSSASDLGIARGLLRSAQGILLRTAAELLTYSSDGTILSRAEGARDDTLPSVAECAETLARLYPNGVWCDLSWSSIQDFPGRCASCRRLGDELLRRVQESVQAGATSLGDALERIAQELPERLRILDCRCIDHPSNCGVVLQLEALAALLSVHSIPDVQRAENAQGRFPPNLLLSHIPPDANGDFGCVPRGTKRVKATSIHGESTAVRRSGVHAEAGGHQTIGRVQPVRGYADADGTEECESWECAEGCPVKALDDQAGERGNNHRPNRVVGQKVQQGARHFGNIDQQGATYSDTGGPSRYFPNFPPDALPADDDGLVPFFYTPKASRRERNCGLDGMPERNGALRENGRFNSGGRSLVNGEWVETGSIPQPKANDHPTTKPVALMRWLCRLVTPQQVPDGDGGWKSGVILDPFLGSGTTGMGALLEGFDFIGIDQDAHYVNDIARHRIAHVERHGEDWLKAAGKANGHRTSGVYANGSGRRSVARCPDHDRPLDIAQNNQFYKCGCRLRYRAYDQKPTASAADLERTPEEIAHAESYADLPLFAFDRNGSDGATKPAPTNGRDGEATATTRYTTNGGSNFAMLPGRRRRD